MRQHTHQVPIKTADSILDEFLLGQSKQQQLQQNHYFKRPAIQETTKPLKVPSSPSSESPSDNLKPQFGGKAKTYQQQQQQRQENLLFSISGSSLGNDSFRPSQPPNGACQASIEAATSQIVQIQRKLIGFFFVYATIILTLYLTYAVYSYYQQGQLRRQQQQQPQQFVLDSSQLAASGAITPASSLVSQGSDFADQQQQQDQEPITMKPVLELQTKLEGKIHLLERYIEMLALDLEDTKGRLREREKCACSIGCSMNGTRFSDGQRWQQKCDTCTCQAGKISCLPRECPKTTQCDDPVQLPGQCCPVCMKKCKINNGLVRHGHSFRPTGTNGEPAGKQCKCHDGLIKCEPIKSVEVRPSKGQLAYPAAAAKNRTLEYLKSILGSRNAAAPMQLPLGSLT